MFTGIVEAIGTIRSVTRRGGGAEVAVELGETASGLELGESVSVSGSCLTVTKVSGSVASFDCVAETMSRTKIGDLKPGSKVNIERALQTGARLGGHFVTGHIDGIGSVSRVSASGEGKVLEVSAPPEVLDYIVEKGSVALDGASLTIASVAEGGFSVVLVPFTLEHTTLGALSAGDKLNIEGDLLGKYVRKFLTGRRDEGGMSEGFLAEHGFI